MSTTMEAPRIISMECSTSGRGDCYYRIRAGTSIKYVTTEAGALDAESVLDMPLDFQNILPPLPYYEHGWNSARISRNTTTGKLEPTFSQTKLPSVQTIWHQVMINVLDMERTQQLSLLVQKCVWRPRQQTVIAKVARFPWEVQYIEAETRIYQLLQQSELAPSFLGHVHEEGRVIGFLLENLEGRAAGLPDLNMCEAALRRLHGLGISHGDCNRYNFIISSDGRATLIDFERAKVDVDPEVMQGEVANLASKLADESGFGGGFMTVDK